MSKYTTKTIKSADGGNNLVELHAAEDEVEKLISEGWTVESERCNAIQQSDVYMSNPHSIHASLFDYCWILKKEVEEPRPLYD